MRNADERKAHYSLCPFPVQAYVRRFPKCALIPMFVDSEVINQSRSKDGSVLVTERRCTIDVDAPRLLKRVHLFSFQAKKNFFICILLLNEHVSQKNK